MTSMLMLMTGNARIPDIAVKPIAGDRFHITGASSDDFYAMTV